MDDTVSRVLHGYLNRLLRSILVTAMAVVSGVLSYSLNFMYRLNASSPGDMVSYAATGISSSIVDFGLILAIVTAVLLGLLSDLGPIEAGIAATGGLLVGAVILAVVHMMAANFAGVESTLIHSSRLTGTILTAPIVGMAATVIVFSIERQRRQDLLS